MPTSDAMATVDLLNLVQPAEGWFAIVGIRGARDVQQQLVATREEADALIAQYTEERRNVFYGVAKYASDSGRTKNNVKALKAFWVDIDCGPTKAEVNEKTGRPDGYVDQETALKALKKFCKTVGLPRPTLVSSGYGIHAYWPLVEEIGRAEWEAIAARLQELCITQEFHVDSKVFEVARILRVPGTYNFKQDEPVLVEMLSASDPIPVVEFRDILGVPETKNSSVFAEWDSDPRGEVRKKSTGYSFKRIMQRSLKGTGCNQLKHAYENRATLGYYEWFYALSVAAMCDDAATATHTLSEGHPGYDPEELDRKVATIKMATSCSKFRSVNPELCAGCPHIGTILGPKQLGTKVREANKLIFEERAIPPFPKPFFRGEGGGIWRAPPVTEKEAEPILIHEHDVFVIKRMEDNDNEVVLLRRWLPQDGNKEFTVPMEKVTQRDELRKALSSKGVYTFGKRFDHLMEYVIASAQNLQFREKMEIMRQQFGWVDNGSRFVLGDQEITADGNIYSPPSKATQKLSRFIGPVGTLEKWREVWALYGAPGMEAHAFAALSAFGSPLLRFLNQTGAVINLFNPRSGTGKTTVLNMVNSVYGHPRELRLKEIDTVNSKLQWVGILNNLPATMDEMTNAEPKDYSDILYALSNGKGKERMIAGGNELRENNTTWQNITVSTANTSFAEKLSLIKNNPEGELMRLIEYPVGLVETVSTAEAKMLFDTVLMNNYGHAGPIFLRYVLSNLEHVVALCTRIQAKIDREVGLLPKERFWSATVAANIVGGMIARHCELIDWDIDAIYHWACGCIERLRSNTDAPLTDVEQVIGDYLYRNMQSILVVDDKVDRRTNMQALPKREPRGELLIRIEPDTRLMWVMAKPFKDHCVKYQINYAETVRRLKEKGRLIKREQKRLSKGMAVSGDPVHCLCFSLGEDFVNVDDYTEAKKDNAD